MIKPLTRREFGKFSRKDLLEYHGYAYREGYGWEDVDKLLMVNPGDKIDDQYIDYLENFELIMSPLMKALR